MERSLALASSPSRPMCLNHGSTQLRSPTQNSNPTTVSLRSTRRLSMAVRATESSTARPTLSSNWVVSSATASPLPRFEDLDTSSMLIRQRIIFLGSPIDDMSADLLIGQIIFLDAEDPTKDIKLFINSPGGSVTSAMAVYDVMKMCKADISTVCMGLTASMSTFLLAGGTKGKRLCMPNSRVMIRQPHGYGGGSTTESFIRAREANYNKNKVMKTLARITGKSEEQLEYDSRHDKFMNAWEAKEYGLVDEVIDDGKPGLVAPITEAVDMPKRKIPGPWKAEGNHRFGPRPSEHNLLKKKESSEGMEQESTSPV